MNYTGQRCDDTGLLFYNARYYDPAIGRFISADTIVPGSGPLTVTPSDATAQGMWGKSGGGAANPQELNRYSYVNNNPIKNTDPSGHCIWDACIVEAGILIAIVIGGTLIAVNSSPHSGMNFSDYDWTNWSLPGSAPQASSRTGETPQQSLADPSLSVPRPHLKGKEQYLSTGGSRPYIPQKQKGAPEVVRVKGGGYVDADGNTWVWDPSGHGGPHFDVQHPDGTYTNVYPDGEVHQGNDNFPQAPKEDPKK